MNPELSDEIRRVYEKQCENRWKMAATTASERINRLKRLKQALWGRRSEMHGALYDDFKKNPGEADLTEILPVMAEIKHTIKHLESWMRPIRVKTPWLLFGTTSEIRYEPKGLVLILSPWNYPVYLSINPLVAALGAGNCVIVKPSSKVPHTARFLKKLLSDLFPEEEVALFEGSSAVCDELLKNRFDHIFFTGSSNVGKTVMAAAARQLTPVTLELGGKSPAIVDETADVQKTAERVMWGKFINAGQTCVAPDYLLIQESRFSAFVECAKKILMDRYGHDPASRKANPSFCRLVSQGSLERLVQLLDESVKNGAKIEFGGLADIAERYLEPTLLSGVSPTSPIMQDEIFGPVLPILTFQSLDQLVHMIRSRESPLALYIFSNSKSNIDYLLNNTTAGGTCVNSLVIHLANPELPFGGVGHSGMGNYHGFFGFRTLSHERSVLKQGKIDTLKWFYPPYTKRLKRLIEIAAKRLS